MGKTSGVERLQVSEMGLQLFKLLGCAYEVDYLFKYTFNLVTDLIEPSVMVCDWRCSKLAEPHNGPRVAKRVPYWVSVGLLSFDCAAVAAVFSSSDSFAIPAGITRTSS